MDWIHTRTDRGRPTALRSPGGTIELIGSAVIA
ncbi:hypothetical protein ABIF68_003928 [Bradyrhizobium japonicum]|nr:hypothetical protein [Bradyrhizobium japonicum]